MAERDRAESSGARLARYYDLDLADDPGDLDMYLALAQASSGPVLELGTGSGRISVPLAAAGHDVLGVDNDRDMLDRAAVRWSVAAAAPGTRGSLELVAADLTEYRAERRFGLVFIALNSLLLLERAAQRSAIASAAAALAPAGRLVIDAWLPTPDDLALYDGRLLLDWTRRDDETGESVSKMSAATYRSGARTAEITSIFDAWLPDGDAAVRRVVRQDRIAFASAHELIALVEAAGLELETLAGDYEMNPFADEGDRLVLVGRHGGD